MIGRAEIHRMSLPEKLALLEDVWSELSSDPDQIETPDWHREILDERAEAIRNGSETVIDWEEAKKQIEDRIR